MLRQNAAEIRGVPNYAAKMSSSADSLPKQFITSMKTLFDILDDKNTGFVRYTDIEKGWRDDGCKELPFGVLDSLRKVTPANGLLSFERFCAGLKLSLLRNQPETAHIANATSQPVRFSKTNFTRSQSPRSPLSNLAKKNQCPKPATPAQQLYDVGKNPTARLYPRNHLVTAQRTLSLPQLSPDLSEQATEMCTVNLNVYNSPPPPKPPRATALATNKTPVTDKNDERNALQNWQNGLLLDELGTSKKLEGPMTAYINRGSADGGSTSSTNFSKKKSCSNFVKRRERRHTLQNGIDFNTLRRIKQYEEEYEMLLLGLDSIEKTRDWYLQQIAQVHEKIRCLRHMGEYVDHWSEVKEERFNYQRQRILEVNRCVEGLAAGWEVPDHYNLAISQKKNFNNLNSDNFYFPKPFDERRQQNVCLSNCSTKQQTLLLSMLSPLQVSQLQSSPSSVGNGRLIDADIVY